MSSTYADVALLTVWSWDMIASITDFISGTTVSPNPNRVRQKHWPWKMTVLNGHSTLLMWIWRYAFRRSRSNRLTPCCRHSLSFYVHTSALAVKASTKPSISGSQAPDTPSASAWLPLRELDPWVGQVLLNMATTIHSAATVGSHSYRHPWYDKALHILAHYYSVC